MSLDAFFEALASNEVMSELINKVLTNPKDLKNFTLEMFLPLGSLMMLSPSAIEAMRDTWKQFDCDCPRCQLMVGLMKA